MRDDFPESVRMALARRVNNTCSNPDCCATTTGPHSDETKSVSVGVAAHISAAAAKGPRYRVELTPEQRSAISNAIWLCQTCATKIDRDAGRYPEQVLREWKTGAEARADRRLGRPAGAGDVDASTAPTASVPARFNLLVSGKTPEPGRVGEWDLVATDFLRSRFLSHTNDDVAASLKPLTPAAIAELCAMPAVFAYEHQYRLPARRGRITAISVGRDTLTIDFELDDKAPPIDMSVLNSERAAFRIADGELNTIHWAVKDVSFDAALEKVMSQQRGAVAVAVSPDAGPPDGNALAEAKVRFQRATSNWRQRHGAIAGFMKMRAVPLARVGPLRFETSKQILLEARVREKRIDSDYAYPWWAAPAWRPPGYLEAEAPGDFPPSLLHFDGSGAIAIARSHWEDQIYRDRDPKVLQVGQLARELAASLFFAVRAMRRLGVSAFEYSFTLFHADQRVVTMGAESAREQRGALSAKDSVLPVAARVDASCRPRDVAVSLLEDMLAFLNVENTRRFADDTLADLEIDDVLK